ncbi:MAG: prepilin-type N-terminal cleavage/methylation domain-containing protein, partial [Pseudomonadota bacterium]
PATCNLQPATCNLQPATCVVRMRERGFTLVELSIVLVIIGLIAGGVLFGQDLINNARLTRVVSELAQFKAKTNAFSLKFNQLPGDMPDFQSYYPTCTGSIGTAGCNGNGNGSVDGVAAPNLDETCRFWEHLKLAGFGDDYALNLNHQNAGSCMQGNSPKSAYNDMAYWYMVYNATVNTTIPGAAANTTYFALSSGNVFGRIMTSGTTAIMSPPNAYNIDNKIDDGIPTKGMVIATNGGTNGGTSPAPNVSFKLYCVTFGPNAANNFDYPNYIYYKSYNSDSYGCVMFFKAGF